MTNAHINEVIKSKLRGMADEALLFTSAMMSGDTNFTAPEMAEKLNTSAVEKTRFIIDVLEDHHNQEKKS